MIRRIVRLRFRERDSENASRRQPNTSPDRETVKLEHQLTLCTNTMHVLEANTVKRKGTVRFVETLLCSAPQDWTISVGLPLPRYGHRLLSTNAARSDCNESVNGARATCTRGQQSQPSENESNNVETVGSTVARSFAAL